MATPFWIKLIPVKSFRKMLKQKQREKEFRERFRAKVAFSCDIGNFDALQANGCIFPHPVGIVISRYVKVGRGCVFYQNVTSACEDIHATAKLSLKNIRKSATMLLFILGR